MERRIVDGEITLVPYDPSSKASLPWYQDADVCKQVDNRNSVYDLKLLKAMYRYLNARGSLFYIKYRGRLCGDVCLHPDGEINIVVAKSFQNKHIGGRVIGEIQKLAREQHIPKLHAEIYSFNAQSQRMFERVAGFHKAGDELYEMEYNFQIEKAPARGAGAFFILQNSGPS